MTFSDYIQEAWKNHSAQCKKVAAEFSQGATLAKSDEELKQLVDLVTHVLGEHLGEWKEGILFLTTLKNQKSLAKNSMAQNAITRSLAAFQISAEQTPDLRSFSRSDQICILALASSLLCDRDFKKSKRLLGQAVALAETNIERNDPANRAIAVTSNNFACGLEEKDARTSEETEWMILCARMSRKFWELAGSWLEISRAEYRLAMVYLQNQDLVRAFTHAQNCLALCRANNAEDLDMYFAYEAVAFVEKAKGDKKSLERAAEMAKTYFIRLTPDYKTCCEASFNKLMANN